MLLKSWGKNINNNLKNRIRDCRRALKNAYEATPNVNFDNIHSLEFKLEKLMEDEEIYWKQMSREEWLKWGFHKRATMRRNENEIKGIMDQNGIWSEDPAIIEDSRGP